MNRQRFISVSFIGGLAGTLSAGWLDSRLALAPGQPELGCRVNYSDGSVTELAMEALDPECVRHFCASYSTQCSRTIRSIQVGMFEPMFQDFGFLGLMNLDREFRRGESISVTYYSGNGRYQPHVVAFITRMDGHDELLLKDWEHAYLRSPKAIEMSGADRWSRNQYGASRPWPMNVVEDKDDDEVALIMNDAALPD